MVARALSGLDMFSGREAVAALSAAHTSAHTSSQPSPPGSNVVSPTAASDDLRRQPFSPSPSRQQGARGGSRSSLEVAAGPAEDGGVSRRPTLMEGLFKGLHHGSAGRLIRCVCVCVCVCPIGGGWPLARCICLEGEAFIRVDSDERGPGKIVQTVCLEGGRIRNWEDDHVGQAAAGYRKDGYVEGLPFGLAQHTSYISTTAFR